LEGRPWLEVINQNVQQLLSESSLRDREVELRGLPDLSLEIIVDGKVYQGLDEIPDATVRDLIQAAIDEWQDEAEAAAIVQASLPDRHPMPFRSRPWLISWLLVVILAFVLPPMFVTPAHMAARFSLLWVGGMLGGLIGAVAGRAIVRRVIGTESSRAVMLGGILGGGLSVPLGFFITAGILSVLFP
jgi:hypothetical protein